MFLRLLLAGCVAIFVTALFAGNAFANRSLTVNRTAFRATSRAVAFNGFELNTTCEVTLNGGTTVSSIAKSPDQIGTITEGRTTNCRGAARRMVILNTLVNPMRLMYVLFFGTLPNITAVRTTVINVRFEMQETFAGNCLYTNESQASLLSETGGGQQYNQWELQNSSAALVRGGFFCPGILSVAGTFALTPSLRVGLL